jgi:WD40 repeat protein
VLASVVSALVAIAGCSRRALDEEPDAGVIGPGDAAASIDAGGPADGGLVVPDAGTILPPSMPFAHCDRFGWGPIRSLAYSPDGARLAVHAGRLVQIYDARSGARLGWVPAVDQYGSGPRFAFTPDGAGIVSAQEDGRTTLFRGSLERSFPGSGLAALSPDGATLAIVQDEDAETIRLWRVADGAPLGRLIGHVAPVLTLAFSRDGTRLVSGGEDETARIWNLSDGSSVVIAAFDRWVVDVAVVNAEMFATVAQGRGMRFWRLTDGAPGAFSPAAWSDVAFASFSADGQLALVGRSGGSDDAVQLRRVSDGQPLWSTPPIPYDPYLPNGMNDQIYGVALAPDGKIAAANMGHGGVRLFNAADGAVARRIDGPVAFARPLIWPDASHASVDDTIYRLADGTPTRRLIGPIWAVSPDNTLVAATTGRVRDLTFSLVRASDGGTAVALPGPAQQAAFSPDGALLAAGARIIRTLDGAQLGTLAGASDFTTAGVAFSAHGAVIAAAVPSPTINRATIVLWSAHDGSELRRLGDITPTASFDWATAWVDIRFSPDGSQLAAAGSDAKVWNLTDGAEVVAIPAPSTQNGVHSGGIDPRWRWLALPDPIRSAVRLYTLPQGQLVDVYTYPTAPGPWAISATFSADGALVVGSQASNSGWTADVWCEELRGF